MTGNLFVRNLLTHLAVLLTLVSSVYADNMRAMPDDNLSYPVLYISKPIEGKITSGSGFYYRKENILYFVTARHVLFSDTAVDLEALPVTLNVPYRLIYRIQYDPQGKKLSFSGVMTEADKIELIRNLSENLLFVQAVEQLYKNSQILQLKRTEGSLYSFPKDRTNGGSNEFLLQLSTLFKVGKIKYHPDSDVAAVKIGMVIENEKGKKVCKLEDGVKRVKGGDFLYLEETRIKRFDEVLESNSVFIFGYPTSITNSNAFLDIKLPLLRKGIVAGKNNQLKLIILDCPVYQGNSGGLVVEVDEKWPNKYFNGIGLITNFVPFRNEGSQESQNSGYSVAVPIDQVSELLKD